jgi:hypothetical protein
MSLQFKDEAAFQRWLGERQVTLLKDSPPAPVQVQVVIEKRPGKLSQVYTFLVVVYWSVVLLGALLFFLTRSL